MYRKPASLDAWHGGSVLDAKQVFDTIHKGNINAFPTNGLYINEQMDLKVEINGLNMKDPNGKIRRLIPKSSSEFYVECLPVIIRFNELGNIIISGGQICECWTMFGTKFTKMRSIAP